MLNISAFPLRFARAAGAVALGAALLAAASSNAPLLVYVGKFSAEVVDGHSFLNHPAVVKMVEAAVVDKGTIAILLSPDDTTTAPIFRDATGITYIACQKLNCAAHNWSIRLNLGNTGGSVCYYDASLMPGFAWVMSGNGRKTKIAGNCHSGVPILRRTHKG